jgi:hypothetical protein
MACCCSLPMLLATVLKIYIDPTFKHGIDRCFLYFDMVTEKRDVIIELAKQLHKQTIFKTETRYQTGFFVFTRMRFS